MDDSLKDRPVEKGFATGTFARPKVSLPRGVVAGTQITDGGFVDLHDFGVETWDPQDRLIAALVSSGGTPSQYSWKYDYRSRRTFRSGSGQTEVIAFSGGTSVSQWSVTSAQAWNSSTPSSTGSVHYIRGSDFGGGVGGILYSTDNTGNADCYEYGTRGDVTGIRNPNGTLLYQATYSAFGTHTNAGDAGRRRHRASTKEEESGLGILNEGYRYRDTATGAFLSRDPAGFIDGPNLYAYVRQNPWSTFDPLGLAERKKLSGDSYFVKNKTGDRYQMVVPELKNTGSHNRGWDKTWRVSGYAVSPMLVEDPASLSAEEISKMREMVEDQYNADRELASAEANYQSAKELASLIPGASIGIAYVEEGPKAAAVEAGKEVALTAVGFGIYKYAKSLAKVSKAGSSAAKSGPFVPDEYWRRNAPANVTPGTKRLDHIKHNTTTGQLEESRVIYDDNGRKHYRVDKTDHGRPTGNGHSNDPGHTNPHLHESTYAPAGTQGHSMDTGRKEVLHNLKP